MAIWTCQTCHSRWEAKREPAECSSCRGRLLVPERSAPNNPERGSGLLRWYTATFWGSFALLLLGVVLVVGSADPGLVIVGGSFVAISFLLGISAAVLSLIILHRAWTAIQPLRHILPSERNMPTPGKAAGFLFIPFFNLYWVFVAYYGLAKRANRLLADRGSNVRPANDGLALTFAILSVSSVLAGVPLLGVIYAIIFLVIAYLVHRDVDRISRLLPAY